MLELILILALALVCAGLAFWALRRPPVATSAVLNHVPGPAQRPLREAASSPAAAPPAAATPARRPALAVLEFEGTLGRVEITRPEVVIGRHSEDDVKVPDIRVSRHHAKLVAKRGGGFEIQNLTAVRSEPNPMLINGQTRELADVSDGDIVTLGGVSFTFRRAA